MEELEWRAAVQLLPVILVNFISVKTKLVLLTERVDGEGGVRRRAERSDSCRIAGSNPELVLCSFDQTGHLGATDTFEDL